MSIGASVLSLMGRKDPREALLQSILAGQGGGGAQYAGTQAGAGATTGADPQAEGAGAQPQVAEQTEAFKSPPDLSALYQDILKYNTKESNINRGFGLIGSAVSQDGNREATMQSFLGDRPEGDRVGLKELGTMAMELNKADIAKKQMAARLASLPAIAKKYGLDLETAQYLLQTGELDKVIAEKEKPVNLTAETLANGQIAPFDPRAGTLGEATGPLKAPDLTADQKDYDAYVTDEARRGNNNPLSFNDWSLQSKKAGAGSTTVNNLPATPIDKEKDEFAKKRGEKLGERYVNIQTAADKALETLDSYDLIERGLNTDVRTGALGESELALRKLGASLGLDTDPNKIAGGELITAVQNRMALAMRNPESGMGMPGSLSDKDIEFLKAAQIGMGTSGPGNRTLLEAYRRIEKRKIEIADLADDYADKFGSLRGFNKVASEFNAKNPLFEGIQVGNESVDDKKKRIGDKYGIKF